MDDYDRRLFTKFKKEFKKMNELEVIEQARELVPSMDRLDPEIAIRKLIDAHLMTVFEYKYYLDELRNAQYALENFHERLGELARIAKKHKEE